MNYKITAVDTDGMFFNKEDGSKFTEEEQDELVSKINNVFPEKIKWELGGYYQTIITLKAKNYILFSPDGIIKYKGSSLKSSTLEPALKLYIDETVKCLLEDRHQDVLAVYNKYVKEIYNINKDNIKQWSSKKTLTDKVYNSDRLNEKKLLEAVGTAEYSPGDKVFVFFNDLDGLSLVENFKEGCYNKDRLLDKLFKVSKRFSSVINTEEMVNFKLKKNKKQIENLFIT